MLHIFKYRVKSFLKNKMIIFWGLAFPIALCTMFSVVFSDMGSTEELEVMKVAIVEKGNAEFAEFVKQISDSKGDVHLIDPVYVDQKKADEMVMEKEVDAAIIMSEKPSLLYSTASLQSKILESVIQDYMRISSTIQTIGQENPMAMNQETVQKIIDDNVKIKTVESGGGTLDSTVIYYYSALAMTVMYSALWGLKSMEDSQANQSAKAIRLNVAPTHKLKVILIDYLVAFLVATIEISIVFAYLIFVINIDFGEHFLLTYLVSLCGILMSIAIGIALGCISKLKTDTSMNLIGTGTVVSCFLAGMMVGTMPYIIDKFAPFVKYINPATLISNSYSILYYYEDISPVFVNIGVILLLCVVILAISYRALRRKAYASI